LQVARRARLLEALQRDGVLRISDLTDTLGAAAVTIRRDIAQLAAEGLVRRVHGGVALLASEETPVPEDAAAGAGTSVGARSLGMLVPSLDYYWPDVARGAEEAARELDMRVVLRGSSYETEDDRPQLTRLVEQLSVDGLIIAPRMDAPTTDRTLEWLTTIGIPVVLMERTATVGPQHGVLESVVTDHAMGAAMAVRHLVSLGHRRVGAVLAEHSPHRPHIHRGWLEALTECGLDAAAAAAAALHRPGRGAAGRRPPRRPRPAGASRRNQPVAAGSGLVRGAAHAPLTTGRRVHRGPEKTPPTPRKRSINSYWPSPARYGLTLPQCSNSASSTC